MKQHDANEASLILAREIIEENKDLLEALGNE